MIREKHEHQPHVVAGIAVHAGLIAGLAALVAAVFAFLNADWVGSGLCLLAAGLSFGLIANALLRS